MASIPSIQSLTIDLPPSCIAFSPAQPRYFVVGTYLLHPKAQGSDAVISDSDVIDGIDNGKNPSEEAKRTGSLILFRLDGDEITLVSTLETDFAVLDVQWTPHTERLGNLLAVATSHGLIQFYTLDVGNDTTAAVLRETSNWILPYDGDEDLLVLSVTWHPSKPEWLALTMSDGAVYVCESENTDGEVWAPGSSTGLGEVLKHELEAWTAAFTGDDGIGVLSGGDDAVLRYRSFKDGAQTAEWQDRRIHQAGVVAILPLTDDLVVTGSYDDHIRLVSCPAGRRREVKAELDLGGGVWRLKLLSGSGVGSGQEPKSLDSFVLLASCMHAGARIVQLSKSSADDAVWAFQVKAKFEEHKSMNYGSDVQPGNDRLKRIVSTSFYDKLLAFWKVDLESSNGGAD